MTNRNNNVENFNTNTLDNSNIGNNNGNNNGNNTGNNNGNDNGHGNTGKTSIGNRNVFENTINGNSTVCDLINGVDTGTCTVTCVNSNTVTDASGDYRITRQLEFNEVMAGCGPKGHLELEVSGTLGATPVVTLGGRLLPNNSVAGTGNDLIEVTTFRGMVLDVVQLPLNEAAALRAATAANRPGFRSGATPTTAILGITVKSVSGGTNGGGRSRFNHVARGTIGA